MGTAVTGRRRVVGRTTDPDRNSPGPGVEAPIRSRRIGAPTSAALKPANSDPIYAGQVSARFPNNARVGTGQVGAAYLLPDETPKLPPPPGRDYFVRIGVLHPDRPGPAARDKVTCRRWG